MAAYQSLPVAQLLQGTIFDVHTCKLFYFTQLFKTRCRSKCVNNKSAKLPLNWGLQICDCSKSFLSDSYIVWKGKGM